MNAPSHTEPMRRTIRAANARATAPAAGFDDAVTDRLGHRTGDEPPCRIVLAGARQVLRAAPGAAPSRTNRRRCSSPGGDDQAIVTASSNLRWRGARACRADRSSAIGSVCDGAFIRREHRDLAAARGRRTGHHVDRVARMHPEIDVDREASSSATVGSGPRPRQHPIDMHWRWSRRITAAPLADSVAAHLVLYARRPDFPVAVSETLVAQTSASDPLARFVCVVRANMRRFARRPQARAQRGMSVRSLHRRCLQVLDTTPQAHSRSVASSRRGTLSRRHRWGPRRSRRAAGFGSAPRMTRAFERTLASGRSPIA